MNSQSGRQLSPEELRALNAPRSRHTECPVTRQALEDFDRRLTLLLERTAEIQNRLDALPEKPELESVRAELEKVKKRLPPAGKKKGRSFSLPSISLPEWMRPRWSWLLLLPVLAALLVMWYSLDALWRGWMTLLP